jgi:large subunit ribosomal protein L4e
VKQEIKRWVLKKNPLNNLGALLKLNPYAKTARRMELLAQEQRAKAKAEKLDNKRKISKVWFSLGHLTSLQHCRR